jgi:hypothetical protein
MAQSYTTVPTHATGDYLPMADWNGAATILNSGLSVVSTRGTYAGPAPSGGNGPAPFYVYSAIRDDTTNASGQLNFAINGGGFPNGLITVIATLCYQNSAGTSQAGHTLTVDYAASSGASIYLWHHSGVTSQNNFPTRYNVLAIGY